MLSVLLDISMWVESPDHNGTMFNLLRNAKLFYKLVAPFCILDSNVWRLLTSPHSNQHLLLSVFWNYTCHRRYEEVYQCGISFSIGKVLLKKAIWRSSWFDSKKGFISLTSLSIFSCAYWAFRCLFWRKVFSNPFLIIKLGSFIFYLQ